MCVATEIIQWHYQITQVWEHENPAQWLKDYGEAGWELVNVIIERRWRSPIKREMHYTLVLKFPWAPIKYPWNDDE